MKEWNIYLVHFLYVYYFLYVYIFYKLYVQVKFKFMKNKKIRECLHLFYIKIKSIPNKKNLIFYLLQWLPRIKSLTTKEWKYLVHFLYVFFYEHIFYKLYICTRKIQFMKNKKIRECLLIQI
jgi:hypothetical protein